MEDKATPRKKNTEKKRPGSATSGSEKKRSRPQTIAEAFAAAKAKSAPAVPLETSEATGKTLGNYDSQNIRNTLVHHLTELNTKRRWVPGANSDCYVPEQRTRGPKASSSDEDLGMAYYDEKADSEDWTIGDDDAYRYLCQLGDLISPKTMPTKEQMRSVVAMVRAHGLHGRKDLSSIAFNLLQLIAKWHPSVVVRSGPSEGASPANLPCVVTNSNAWTVIECCDSFSLDQFEEDALESRISPCQLLSHLVSLAHAAIFPEQNVKSSTRSVAMTSGDLLFFKWVLSEMERDLRCRLYVFFAVKGKEFKDRKHALLQNSQLWRAFSGPLSRMASRDRKDLVTSLMKIIAAPAEPEQLPKANSTEECSFNAGEMSRLAAHLLNMLLELYGVAEDSGMFQKHGTNRTTTTGNLENVRMVIEAAMLEALVGSVQVLRELPRKRAFLAALHPKDRLRLLTMIVAKGHARRRSDSIKYPSLERFNFLYTNHGDVGSYLVANPVEALQYVFDDLNLAFNLVDKTADGLALLVSSIVQAASSELESEEALKQLGEVLEKLVGAFGKQSSSQSSKALSPAAQLSLQAAQAAIGVAG